MNLGFRFGRNKPDTRTLSIPDQYARKYVDAQENVHMYQGLIILCEVIGGVLGVMAIIDNNARLAFIAMAWLVGAWYCARRRNWWTGEVALVKEDAAEWEANRLQEESRQ